MSERWGDSPGDWAAFDRWLTQTPEEAAGYTDECWCCGTPVRPHEGLCDACAAALDDETGEETG